MREITGFGVTSDFTFLELHVARVFDVGSDLLTRARSGRHTTQLRGKFLQMLPIELGSAHPVLQSSPGMTRAPQGCLQSCISSVCLWEPLGAMLIGKSDSLRNRGQTAVGVVVTQEQPVLRP